VFVQHHPSHSVLSTEVVNSNEEFDLIIESNTPSTIKGKITFTYLHQLFEASIELSPNHIQVHSLYPFEGIQAAAPTLDKVTDAEKFYLSNGSITKHGKQNVVWLILDIIHLYNIVRLKPAALLTLYRETFSSFKNQAPDLVFGKISPSQPVAKKFSKLLTEQAKRKFKYVYGSPIHLLASIQQIIATYPQPSSFLQSAKKGDGLVIATQ
jgi:hypothetical protein